MAIAHVQFEQWMRLIWSIRNSRVPLPFPPLPCFSTMERGLPLERRCQGNKTSARCNPWRGLKQPVIGYSDKEQSTSPTLYILVLANKSITFDIKYYKILINVHMFTTNVGQSHYFWKN
jgi:hypothetical protein